MGNWFLWVSALTRFRLERVVRLLDLDVHGFIGFLRVFVSTWLRGLLLLDGNKFLSIYLFIYFCSFGYYYRIFWCLVDHQHVSIAYWRHILEDNCLGRIFTCESQSIMRENLLIWLDGQDIWLFLDTYIYEIIFTLF